MMAAARIIACVFVNHHLTQHISPYACVPENRCVYGEMASVKQFLDK